MRIINNFAPLPRRRRYSPCFTPRRKVMSHRVRAGAAGVAVFLAALVPAWADAAVTLSVGFQPYAASSEPGTASYSLGVTLDATGFTEPGHAGNRVDLVSGNEAFQASYSTLGSGSSSEAYESAAELAQSIDVAFTWRVD